jgi:PleD family two-component response regulator
VVTISAGIAVADAHSTAQSLLQAADHALYLAKKGGRDQVVRAGAAPAVLNS